MVIKMSTTVSEEFEALRRQFNISWAEALRVGLSILFMERGVTEFVNPLNKERIQILLDHLNKGEVNGR